MLNLKKNDIIIIFVIFILFCIFVYINIRHIYKENFYITNTSNIKSALTEFYSYFNNYIIEIEKINNEKKDKFDKFKEIFKKDKDNYFKDIQLDLHTYINNLEKSINNINKLTLNIDIDKTNIHKKDINNYLKIIYDFNKSINKIIIKQLFSSNTTQSKNNLLKPNIDSKSITDESLKENISRSNKNNEEKHSIIKICNISINNEKMKKYIQNIKNNYDVLINSLIQYHQSLIENIDFLKSYLKTLILNQKLEALLNIFLSNYRKLLIEMYIENVELNFYNVIFNSVNCNTDVLKIIYENKYNIYNQHYSTINNLLIELKDNNKEINEFLKNNDNMFKYSNQSKFFKNTKKEFELEVKFCEKLKALDKPSNNNLFLQNLNDEIKIKKQKYIEELENKRDKFLNEMNDKEIYDYNLNRLRKHEQAFKQYNAIKKGIDNIKNRNKVKINLT